METRIISAVIIALALAVAPACSTVSSSTGVHASSSTGSDSQGGYTSSVSIITPVTNSGGAEYSGLIVSSITIPDSGPTPSFSYNPGPEGVTLDADPVPEPATFLLFGGGLLGVAAYRRRSRRA